MNVTTNIVGGSPKFYQEEKEFFQDRKPMLDYKNQKQQVISADDKEDSVFGTYMPQITMFDDSSITLRVVNITPFDENVRLFYAGSGNYDINDFSTDLVFKAINMESSDWNSTFQNADGSNWVADGVSLPYAFGEVRTITVKFAYSSTLITASLNTSAGKNIDEFMRDLNEEVAQEIVNNTAVTDIKVARAFLGASPLGIIMLYDGDTLFMKPTTGNDPLGSSFQSVEVSTLFPQTLFSPISLPPRTGAFRVKNDLGFNIITTIADLSGSSYNEFVESLLNQEIYIENFRRLSNSPEQTNEPFKFIKYNLDGNEATIIQTDVIDPYQYQAVVNEYADVLLDYQTYSEVKMLGGEYLEIKINYEPIGVTTYEEIEKLQEALNKQNEIISVAEANEVEDAYLSFSGFSDKTKKLHNLIILGLITYILIKQK